MSEQNIKFEEAVAEIDGFIVDLWLTEYECPQCTVSKYGFVAGLQMLRETGSLENTYGETLPVSEKTLNAIEEFAYSKGY